MGCDIFNGFKLKLIDLSDNTTVTAAGTNTQQLQAPAGKVYQVVNIYYNAAAPIGAAAGTHKIEAGHNGITRAQNLLICEGAFNTVIRISEAGFAGSTQEVPSAAADQYALSVRGNIYASYSIPVDFVYTNSSDVSQTGTRTLEIVVKEFNEG